MIKACIFDLDGTLAYTLDSMAVVGNEVVRKYGLKPMPIENYRYYCGNGADMLVKRLLVDAGDPELLHYEEARALYRKEFDKDPFYKIQHYPGMPETLKELKKRGVKLGVCSNKPHEAAVKVVERMFGSQIFDAVMGQSDSVRKKPAPDGPLKIAEQFGIKPEECMYLGDSGTDMQTGKAAGRNRDGNPRARRGVLPVHGRRNPARRAVCYRQRRESFRFLGTGRILL